MWHSSCAQAAVSSNNFSAAGADHGDMGDRAAAQLDRAIQAAPADALPCGRHHAGAGAGAAARLVHQLGRCTCLRSPPPISLREG